MVNEYAVTDRSARPMIVLYIEMSMNWPLPVCVRSIERERDGVRGVHARHDVAERGAEPGRRAVGRAARIHQAAHRLGDDVVRGPLAVGAEEAVEAAEAGDAGVDEAGVLSASAL